MPAVRSQRGALQPARTRRGFCSIPRRVRSKDLDKHSTPSSRAMKETLRVQREDIQSLPEESPQAPCEGWRNEGPRPPNPHTTRSRSGYPYLYPARTHRSPTARFASTSPAGEGVCAPAPRSLRGPLAHQIAIRLLG